MTEQNRYRSKWQRNWDGCFPKTSIKVDILLNFENFFSLIIFWQPGGEEYALFDKSTLTTDFFKINIFYSQMSSMLSSYQFPQEDLHLKIVKGLHCGRRNVRNLYFPSLSEKEEAVCWSLQKKSIQLQWDSSTCNMYNAAILVSDNGNFQILNELLFHVLNFLA